MANLLDYLDWRGDLTLKQAPFCEVDNLILAELSFLNFSGIVPGPGEGRGITISRAAELFFAVASVTVGTKSVDLTVVSSFKKITRKPFASVGNKKVPFIAVLLYPTKIVLKKFTEMICITTGYFS
jgi:hypothetical protein